VTPSTWPDYPKIEQAIAAINETVQCANEAKRVTDDLLRVMELQSRLVIKGSAPDDLELQQMHRLRFIKDGVVKVTEKSHSPKRMHMILFKYVRPPTTLCRTWTVANTKVVRVVA
jgi:hypothetical protein